MSGFGSSFFNLWELYTSVCRAFIAAHRTCLPQLPGAVKTIARQPGSLDGSRHPLQRRTDKRVLLPYEGTADEPREEEQRDEATAALSANCPFSLVFACQYSRLWKLNGQ
jgi:hypothetical protein